MRANPLFIPLAALGVLGLAACGSGEEAPASAPDAAPGAATAPADMTASSARATGGDTGTAQLNDNEGDSAGSITLTQAPTGLLMRVEAEGLTPGWHGIHIHAVGDCSDAAFQSAGGHINHEAGPPHGLLNPDGPDAGDLPNVHADDQGRVRAEIFTTQARIADSGPGQWLWDEDGSAIVIHANADDHNTQPIGGAGDRVACAVVNRG